LQFTDSEGAIVHFYTSTMITNARFSTKNYRECMLVKCNDLFYSFVSKF